MSTLTLAGKACWSSPSPSSNESARSLSATRSSLCMAMLPSLVRPALTAPLLFAPPDCGVSTKSSSSNDSSGSSSAMFDALSSWSKSAMLKLTVMVSSSYLRVSMTSCWPVVSSIFQVSLRETQSLTMEFEVAGDSFSAASYCTSWFSLAASSVAMASKRVLLAVKVRGSCEKICDRSAGWNVEGRMLRRIEVDGPDRRETARGPTRARERMDCMM